MTRCLLRTEISARRIRDRIWNLEGIEKNREEQSRYRLGEGEGIGIQNMFVQYSSLLSVQG
jgi:hypothetical protein